MTDPAATMLEVGRMDTWWRLTRDHQAYRRATQTPLKDFGYLKLFELLDNAPRSRVLEFGHGFNTALLARYQDTHDVWGLDDRQDLPYFPSGDDWERQYREHVVDRCPAVTLRRGLLGAGSPVDVPPASMDLVASVSVLEEIPRPDLAPLVAHAADLLAPGGRFVGTCDIKLTRPGKIVTLVEAMRSAGLVIDVDERALIERLPTMYDEMILENPSMVMLTYQMQDGDGRAYEGHWGTAWFIARKP